MLATPATARRHCRHQQAVHVVSKLTQTTDDSGSANTSCTISSCMGGHLQLQQ
jgi:hypothetical protein